VFGARSVWRGAISEKEYTRKKTTHLSVADEMDGERKVREN